MYDILEVSPQATLAEIRAAYERHRQPYEKADLESIPEAQRREIEDYLAWLDYAWNVLSRPESRRLHDLELRGDQPVPPDLPEPGRALSEAPLSVNDILDTVEAGPPSRAWDIAFWVAVGVAVVGGLVYLSAK
jgi:hypothetical protein